VAELKDIAEKYNKAVGAYEELTKVSHPITKAYSGKTPEFDEWSKQEQAELEQIHKDYLQRLKANEIVRRKYEAISAEYKKKHLAHISHYSSTASSRRSTL